MSTASKAAVPTNPVFNKRKLRLGTFSTNLEHGCAMTDIEGVLRISWDASLELARLANEMEFEALVPVGRWKGFGGKVNFNGRGFECFTWAAAMGVAVPYPAVFSTSHISTIHPLMAAKQAASIDHISGGRFVLNVVTGWNRPEMEMFGVEMADHDTRYDMAAEWIEIVKKLWTAEEPFDHEGTYYRLNQALVSPHPIQRPHPPVMCAGGSPKGLAFSAKYCDIAFILVDMHDPGKTRDQIVELRRVAREEHGNPNLQVWASAYVVVRDTEEEAKKFLHYYVDERGDWEGATGIVNSFGMNAQTLTPDVVDQFKRHFIAGWAGYPLVGTKEQVVDGLELLVNEVGLDGVVLSWADYHAGMIRFRDEVMPLLKQAGLR